MYNTQSRVYKGWSAIQSPTTPHRSTMDNPANAPPAAQPPPVILWYNPHGNPPANPPLQVDLVNDPDVPPAGGGDGGDDAVVKPAAVQVLALNLPVVPPPQHPFPGA